MPARDAFPGWPFRPLAVALMALIPVAASGFSAKPEDPEAAKVVSQLLATDFTQACDVNTYALEKNLAYLFETDYIGLEFRSWAVTDRDGKGYRVILHYIDGEAGATTATWRVDMASGESRMVDDNAEVVSCMTGYL